MSAPWGHAVLAEHVGETFGVQTAAGERRLELVEVEVLPARETRDDAIRTEPFTLLFRVADGEALPQGTYRFEHAELDAIDVFVVPNGPDRNEAVFN